MGHINGCAEVCEEYRWVFKEAVTVTMGFNSNEKWMSLYFRQAQKDYFHPAEQKETERKQHASFLLELQENM